MMWKNYYTPPLDWWTVERKTNQATATEPTGSVIAGSAQTEGGMQNINCSAEDSEGSSEERNTHSQEEYFDPDPYDEAAEATETEFFSLGR